MAVAAERFVCQQCGATASKWAGRCDDCGAWNAIAEEVVAPSLPKGLSRAKGHLVELVGLGGQSRATARLRCSIGELDRVCGGGLVPSSALLVGGDPGIGKSTLLLQALAGLGREGHRCVYVSGEEAVDQIRSRARRLAVADATLEIAAATSVRDILTTLRANPPAVFVIDSIQTMFIDNLESAPGSVGQVRASAQALIQFAKESGSIAALVGHVTKDGQISGPRVLEHMVDTVLYFEGERSHQFRILRAVKNRFGPTDEIGVFEMTDRGLREVANPSALFIGDRAHNIAGSAVFAGMEGSRPMLVEVQALVAPSPFATPRRAVVGWDSSRLAMVLAVLEARCDVRFAGNDVYLNIAGGLRVAEPAADLAAAAALISSFADAPLPDSSVVFGEIGLSGEVRPVSQTDARLKEAAKLGFERAFTSGDGRQREASIEISRIDRLDELVAFLRDGR